MSNLVDWRLRLRMLLSLGVIGVVNVVLLAVMLLGVGVLAFATAVVVAVIATITMGESPEVYNTLAWFVLFLPVLAVVGGVIALWWQVRHGARTIVDGLNAEPVDDKGPRGIQSRLNRFAAQADVHPPSAAIVDESEPTCLTVRVDRTPTVIVTTGLLNTVDDAELDAVLAHEITHIANRDVMLATVLASTVTLSNRLFEREQAYREVLKLLLILSVLVIPLLIFGLPLLVFALLYVVVSVLARIILIGNTITLGLFSQTREYAADKGACELTGEPEALMSALRTIEGGGPPETDSRLRATAALGVVPQAIDLRNRDEPNHWLANWLESIGADDPFFEQGWGQNTEPGAVERWLHENVYEPIRDAFNRLRSWRPATHPPTAKRIDQIRRRS